ncbi:MAG: hypothetical protein KDD33_04260 [Bdellovibrionales bacterium]|nr:hypothetical protein [Bdellovibrionales bacterium]
MKNILFLMIIALSSPSFAGLVSSPYNFCSNYKRMGRSEGKSLRNLRMASGLSSLGKSAKDSTPFFEKQGFTNLLTEDERLLEHAGDIPIGSVLVLDPAGDPNCPTNKRHGHVVIKCGANSLDWGGTEKHLGDFVRRHPKCVKSVLYPEAWKKKKSDPKQVCNKFKSSLDKGQSLKALRLAIGSGHLGISAKNAVGPLQRQGFENLLEKDPKLLANPQAIPYGSIFVLDSGTTKCPVNRQHGHVTVKCSETRMTWTKGAERPINDFVKRYPSCIKGIMYNPDWKKLNQTEIGEEEAGSSVQ